MSKYVNISVVTENGAILEKPVTMSFVCSQLSPVGILNVRDYDANDCIIVKKVFGLDYNGSLYGTEDFETMQNWYKFRSSNCVPCNKKKCCVVIYNECLVTYKGVPIYFRNLN